MKVLIIAQVMDERDPVLGFFSHWVEVFAQHVGRLTVICLKEGEHQLPPNVRVLSLGKESGASRLKYLKNFYRFIIAEKNNYDAVFVHMNQEYVLLGAPLWKLWGKKVFMWRNHPAGNWLTRLAILLCDKVFCTSKYSYTARFKKTTLMPVGIDTAIFEPPASEVRQPRSILFLARMAPIKQPDLLLAALNLLAAQGVDFTASFYGDPSPVDRGFYNQLKRLAADYGILDRVRFAPGVPNTTTVAIYGQHDLFVNLSPSGMYDKTIFEAAACGALPVVSNKNLHGEFDERLLVGGHSAPELAEKLKALLELESAERQALSQKLRHYVESRHSLSMLAEKLFHDHLV